MSADIKAGDLVKVRVSGGAVLTRRVVGLWSDRKGAIVGICNPAEFELAKKENRQANYVGFRLTDIVEVLPATRKAAL